LRGETIKSKIRKIPLNLNDNQVFILTVFERISGQDFILKSHEMAIADIDSLINVSPESSLLLELDGKIITLNKVAAKRLGGTVSEMIGKNVFDFFSAPVRKMRKGFMKESLEKKTPLRFSDSRGETVFENWIHPILNSKNEIEKFAVFARDITNIIEANQALIESEEKYRNLVERASDGIVIVQDGIVKFVNTILAEMSGQPVEAIIGTPFERNIHPDAMEEVVQRYRDRIEGLEIPSIYETSLIRVNGERLEVELNAGLISYQNKPADLIFVRDISERKRISRELKESEERFRTLITTMGEGVWVTDNHDRTLFTNKALEKMLGYTEEELMGRLVTDFLAPNSWKDFEDIARQRYENNLSSSTYELTWIRKEGSNVVTRVAGTLILDDEGKTIGSFGVLTDITIQKEIEASLQESEENYRNLVERAKDGITIIQDLKLMYVNPSLAEIVGYSITEMIGTPFLRLVHPDVQQEIEDRYIRRMDGEDVPSIYDSVLRHKDGSRVDVEINAGVIPYKGGLGNLVFVRDISERKRTEKLLQQVKLEEERYHAMLSHFVNNDLQKIVNNLEFIRFDLEKNNVVNPEDIQTIINIASQSSHTIGTVNQVFEVLQSSMNESKIVLPLLDEINKVVNQISGLTGKVICENESLDRLLICDKWVERALSEILYYIQYSCEEKSLQTSPIQIEGGMFAAYYRIVIRDACSPPIAEEISRRLSGTITDNWEYQGHYVGLSLCSVIMQHYGGALKIFPLTNHGNEFQLLFPSILVSSKER
ncbi:MAG: PAS domain S-box protein, partial [Candidatus Hodarchaeales archaeon]